MVGMGQWDMSGVHYWREVQIPTRPIGVLVSNNGPVREPLASVRLWVQLFWPNPMLKIDIVFTRDSIVSPSLELPSREIGACVEFLGIVRELERGEPLRGLQYEAYEVMARRLLERHFAELAVQHPCDSVVFIHRLGWVPVGEASLFIRVLSAHRGEGLRFLAEAIDRLKTDVPIWKCSQ
jgi:molybdopterin synthase catalytic subunit